MFVLYATFFFSIVTLQATGSCIIVWMIVWKKRKEDWRCTWQYGRNSDWGGIWMLINVS